MKLQMMNELMQKKDQEICKLTEKIKGNKRKPLFADWVRWLVEPWSKTADYTSKAISVLENLAFLPWFQLAQANLTFAVRGISSCWGNKAAVSSASRWLCTWGGPSTAITMTTGTNSAPLQPRGQITTALFWKHLLNEVTFPIENDQSKAQPTQESGFEKDNLNKPGAQVQQTAVWRLAKKTRWKAGQLQHWQIEKAVGLLDGTKLHLECTAVTTAREKACRQIFICSWDSIIVSRGSVSLPYGGP